MEINSVIKTKGNNIEISRVNILALRKLCLNYILILTNNVERLEFL